MITGTTLSFAKQVPGTPDAMGNPVNTVTNIEVADCLIGPMTEPLSAREQQALEQSKDQVRIHLPKAYTGDVSDSDVVWNGKTFHVDSDAVVFMPENTPTRWNRYFRAEVTNG